MGRLWNKWLVPALFAVILFLCIRVANDIPKHEYYWESNEWNFMLKDMLVVLFMSYPIFFLLKNVLLVDYQYYTLKTVEKWQNRFCVDTKNVKFNVFNFWLHQNYIDMDWMGAFEPTP